MSSELWINKAFALSSFFMKSLPCLNHTYLKPRDSLKLLHCQSSSLKCGESRSPMNMLRLLVPWIFLFFLLAMILSRVICESISTTRLDLPVFEFDKWVTDLMWLFLISGTS
uniref:Uncharacterized protein n=1 Tax=Cacopsylla melanoneura TaxID=428564 RepID=A0A8D8LRM4_9HEMI